MPYMLIFKGYRGDKLIVDVTHFFNSLRDLHAHAACLLDITNPNVACDRYDIQVKFTETDNTPPAA